METSELQQLVRSNKKSDFVVEEYLVGSFKLTCLAYSGKFRFLPVKIVHLTGAMVALLQVIKGTILKKTQFANGLCHGFALRCFNPR